MWFIMMVSSIAFDLYWQTAGDSEVCSGNNCTVISSTQ